MSTVAKDLSKLFNLAQLPVDIPEAGTVLIHAVAIIQTALGIPTVETPFPTALAIVRRPPVVLRPIPVGPELVDDKVVGEVGDIQHLLDRGIIGDRITEEAHQLVPARGIPRLQAFDVIGVVIFLLPSEVTRGESLVGPLHGIVQPPVQTVDVKVNEGPMPAEAPGGKLSLGGPAIPHEQ